MRFVRAFLSQPPQKMFMYWGHVPPDLADWIQPENLWRIIIYGHDGVLWQNARSTKYSRLDAAVFAPGSRGGHARQGPPSDIVSAFFELTSTGPRPSALPTFFQATQEWYDALLDAGERGNDGIERARALVWHVLWSIAQPVTALREQSGIFEAEDFIRENLGQPLTVPDVAERCGVAYRTLLSWFQAEHGTTVKGFVRQSRAREACRLLAETDESIKAVASKVGVPDLHQFNKLVRSHVGLSPREFRERAG